MTINTAIVAHSVVETYEIGGETYYPVEVRILDGYDTAHAFTIDRPSAAEALIAAAQEYLARNAHYPTYRR